MMLQGADEHGNLKLLFVHPHMLPPGLDDHDQVPEGAPAAVCQQCRQPIYLLPGGLWTLGQAPWWCSTDNDLIGILMSLHEPARRRWTVTVEAATREEAARLAAEQLGELRPGRPTRKTDTGKTRKT